MFNLPTVFILGAGASFECGLPLGTILKERIAQAVRFQFEHGVRQVSGDYDLYRILKSKFGAAINTYSQAGNRLAAALSRSESVDDALHYLSETPHIVELGKVAIVYHILKAERESVLQNEPGIGRPDLTILADTWFPHFYSMAVAGLTHGQLERAFDNITIINFNYDRTLEQFLLWQLQDHAGILPNVAQNIVSSLKFIRPYGRVGPLEWEKVGGLKFGGPDFFGSELFEFAGGIRTYTEQHESAIPGEIDKALSNCHVAILIGFGFHQANMNLFKPLTLRAGSATRTVFATAHGIDPFSHSVLRQQLIGSFATSDVQLLQRTGHSLLSDLRRSILTAAS